MPSELLNEAQLGRFVTLNEKEVSSSSVTIGVNEYGASSSAIASGTPKIVGGIAAISFLLICSVVLV